MATFDVHYYDHIIDRYTITLVDSSLCVCFQVSKLLDVRKNGFRFSYSVSDTTPLSLNTSLR